MLQYKIYFTYREGFMKLLFSFVFLFFLSFQTQAIVLLDYPDKNGNIDQFNWKAFPNKNNLQLHIEYSSYRMDQFDWEAFTNKENIQEHIDYRERRLVKSYLFSVPGVFKSDKIYLIRIEQELELYKWGIKRGLSPEMIQLAEEAIALHWDDINRVENQIKAYTGLGDSVDVKAVGKINGRAEKYHRGVWSLYEVDREIVFSMLKKEDKRLYKALASNDEIYAEFITPFVKRFLKKIKDTAEAYYNSLGGEVDYKISFEGFFYVETTFKEVNVYNLTDIYLNSVEMYNSFIENFKFPIGKHQKELMRIIEDWHAHQAFLGAEAVIEAYKVYGISLRPLAVIRQLREFHVAPIEVKEKIAVFLREDILNNEDPIGEYLFIKPAARIDSLEVLSFLGVATAEEEELYNQAKEQERQKIKEHIKSVEEKRAKELKAAEEKRAKEQKVIRKRRPHSGIGLSFIDTPS